MAGWGPDKGTRVNTKYLMSDDHNMRNCKTIFLKRFPPTFKNEKQFFGNFFSKLWRNTFGSFEKERGWNISFKAVHPYLKRLASTHSLFHASEHQPFLQKSYLNTFSTLKPNFAAIANALCKNICLIFFQSMPLTALLVSFLPRGRSQIWL